MRTASPWTASAGVHQSPSSTRSGDAGQGRETEDPGRPDPVEVGASTGEADDVPLRSTVAFD